MSNNIVKFLMFAILALLVTPTIALPSSAATYQIVGHLNLPSGYTALAFPAPTYIQGVNTVYIFAKNGGTTYLLALSAATGALRGTPLIFGGTLSSPHFVYDTRDGRLFVSQYSSGYQIIAISTTTNSIVASFAATDGATAIAYDSFNNELFSTSCSGGCSSIAGYVDLFNAATGARVARVATIPSGYSSVQTNSIIYDSNNHAIYVEYSGYDAAFSFHNQIAVIRGNSHMVSARMDAPEVNNPDSPQGGNLVFEPTLNVLFDSQPQISDSVPYAGFDAFNTITNTRISSLSNGPSGYDVNLYDAGRQTARGNYVIVTDELAGQSTAPISKEQMINSPYATLAIPALQPSWTEVCRQVLSSSAFNANFADCQSYNTSYVAAGAPHMDILSTVNGLLLHRITDPRSSGVYHHLMAFGDNTISHVEYAAGIGSGVIYEISA